MGSMMADIVIVLILFALVTAACVYIHKERKKGRHCPECPSAAEKYRTYV